MKLDPNAAADAIRGDLQQPAAEDRHIAAFVGKVLDRLGLDHTIDNAGMVMHALHRHDIEPYVVQEYPKHVKPHPSRGSEVVTVNNDAEEREALSEKPAEPEPAEPDEPLEPSDYPKQVRQHPSRGGEVVTVHDEDEEREALSEKPAPVEPVREPDPPAPRPAPVSARPPTRRG